MRLRYKVKIFFPYALICAFMLFGAGFVEFKSDTTRDEIKFLSYSPENINVKTDIGQVTARRVSSDIRSPVGLTNDSSHIVQRKVRRNVNIVRKAITREPAEKSGVKQAPLEEASVVTKAQAQQPDKVYSLTMALISEKVKVAMINNQFVHENDIIDDLRVARIERDRVLLKGKDYFVWAKMEKKK